LKSKAFLKRLARLEKPASAKGIQEAAGAHLQESGNKQMSKLGQLLQNFRILTKTFLWGLLFYVLVLVLVRRKGACNYWHGGRRIFRI
jgi:hypothetical protein